ncbi:MAG: TIGR01777 family oxidoreductase [bacterium]
MKILISGSTGMIGSELVASFLAQGHYVTRLVRAAGKYREPAVMWNPGAGTLNASACEGFDAVVHLSGENIAKRWTAAQKAKIKNSRVHSTTLLSSTLAKLNKRPKVLVSASAIGYYGDRGSEILREDSGPGKGFLAETCVAWESSAQPAANAGIRVVYPRLGVILTPKGGALQKMLLPFKLGVGGVMGDGKQYWSWVALDDVIGAIQHCLWTESLRGPVNVVAPHAVTNHEFTKALGRALSRPTIFPVPAFVARLLLGEMAEELLLASARLEPAQLMANGYKFHHVEVEAALRALLN